MSKTLARVQALAIQGDLLASAHGYDELTADGIFFVDVFQGIASAHVVEDYPDASRGPSVLVLQKDADGRPIHVVWGIPKGYNAPAVLITAYRPDPQRWSGDFMTRKKP